MFSREKETPRRPARARVESEIRFRYPAEDEVSEVSCCPVHLETAQKRTRDRRRAS